MAEQPMEFRNSSEAWDQWADVYDLFVRDRAAKLGDIEFVQGLAQQSGGPVLELGCGYGRTLLPIARARLRCTGVDFSKKMIARFEEELSDERDQAVRDRVTLRCGDMRRFDFPDQMYGLVVFNYGSRGFLIEDGAAQDVIRKAATSLTLGGTLLLERRNPRKYRPVLEFEWTLYSERLQAVISQSLAERLIDEARGIRETTILYTILRLEHAKPIDLSQTEQQQIVIYVREFSLDQMKAMALDAGLSICEIYGDYKGTPFTADSERIILVVGRTT